MQPIKSNQINSSHLQVARALSLNQPGLLGGIKLSTPPSLQPPLTYLAPGVFPLLFALLGMMRPAPVAPTSNPLRLHPTPLLARHTHRCPAALFFYYSSACPGGKSRKASTCRHGSASPVSPEASSRVSATPLRPWGRSPPSARRTPCRWVRETFTAIFTAISTSAICPWYALFCIVPQSTPNMLSGFPHSLSLKESRATFEMTPF